MRIIHTADWHVGVETHGTINPKTGLNTRLHDFLTAIDQVIDYAIKQKADIVLFAGDAFKVRDPNSTHQREFSKKIRSIANAGIPVFLCVGNHDTPLAWGRATSLEIYDTLNIDNVWVSAKPEILTIPTKSGPLQILSIPWLSQDDFRGIGDTLQHLYTQLKPNVPTITVAHADVAGAVYSSEQQVSITPTSQVLPLSLLTHDAIDYVALGHIHKHQALGNKPPVVYSGSVERIDFGEENEEKGFIDVTLEKKKATWKFLPTKTRPFRTITHDIADTDIDPLPAIRKKISQASINDAIVRIILNIDADFSGTIDIAAIRKLCASAAQLTGISRVIEQKTREHSMLADSTTALTPIQALTAYFDAKGIKNKKKKALEKAAKILLTQ